MYPQSHFCNKGVPVLNKRSSKINVLTFVLGVVISVTVLLKLALY